MKHTTFPTIVSCLALLLCWSSFGPPTAAQSVEWNFVAVSAPRQAVVVQTPRGIYTSDFENAALVYPSGRASGFLAISQPNGMLRRFFIFAGRVQFDDGAATGVLMRAREADTRADPGDEITIVVHPEPVLPQECLIYDLLGSQVHARFEAHGRIAVFRN